MSRIAIRPTTVLLCMAVALPLLAAEKLGAKTGLWETTSTTSMGGMALPPELVANMPPAQRAQMEQMMKAQMAPRTITDKSCVTEKDLESGAFQRQTQPDMKCRFTVVSSTPKRQETTFQCTTATGPAEGRMAIDAVDATHVKGSMQLKTQQMSIETKFDSKWLGADCGATK